MLHEWGPVSCCCCWLACSVFIMQHFMLWHADSIEISVCQNIFPRHKCSTEVCKHSREPIISVFPVFCAWSEKYWNWWTDWILMIRADCDYQDKLTVKVIVKLTACKLIMTKFHKNVWWNKKFKWWHFIPQKSNFSVTSSLKPSADVQTSDGRKRSQEVCGFDLLAYQVNIGNGRINLRYVLI